MNFKDFVLVKENPDNFYGDDDAVTFLIIEDCIIYTDFPTSVTHYEIIYMLYEKTMGHRAEVMPIRTAQSLDYHKNSIKIIGKIPVHILKPYFEHYGNTTDLADRDVFMEEIPYSILGRVSIGNDLVSFWNNVHDFNEKNVAQTLELIKLLERDPESFEFEMGHDEHIIYYDQFIELGNKKKTPHQNNIGRQSTDHIIHTIDPAKKGQVMKDMGIKPKAPLGAEKRFAMGEELSFKNFITIKESPDRYFKDEWGDDYASWSNNDAVAFVVDYDFYALMYNHKHGEVFDQLKEWLVDDGHAMDIEFDGIPSKELKNTLSRTTHRNRFLERSPQIILGRLWYDQNIISFWNYREDFTNDTVQQTIKMIDRHFGEASDYTYEIENEKYAYEQFYNITSLNKIPEEPKQPMERPLHELPPELKGQVMKAQGIMPKKPVDIRQKYAYGENTKPLSFKVYLEATEQYIDKIKDAIEKVDERPFNELFGKNERIALKVYSPVVQDMIEEIPDLFHIEKMTNREIGDVIRKNFNALKKQKDKLFDNLNDTLKKYIKDNAPKIIKCARWLVDHGAHFEGDGGKLYVSIPDGRFNSRFSVFSDAASYRSKSKKIAELMGLTSEKSMFDEKTIVLSFKQAVKFITTLIRNTKVYVTTGVLWGTGSGRGHEFLSELYEFVYGKYLEARMELEDYKKMGKIKQAVDQHNIYNYLILTRHPVDVLRMSDHRGISSCHRLMGKYNEDGEGGYSHCAIADAQNSGGVVYLIKGSEYNSIKNNLNAPEIFEDIDRKVRGIRPMGRIRLRRFVDLETGDDFAVPTSAEYGGFTSEYYDKVMKYCQENQKITQNPPSAEYLIDNIVMVGGSYSDYGLQHMINEFFNRSIDWSDIDDGRTVLHTDSHPRMYKRKFMETVKLLGEIPHVDANSIKLTDDKNTKGSTGVLTFSIHTIINIGRQYLEKVSGVYSPKDFINYALPETIDSILNLRNNVVTAKLLPDNKLDLTIGCTKPCNYIHGLLSLSNFMAKIRDLPSRLESRFD